MKKELEGLKQEHERNMLLDSLRATLENTKLKKRLAIKEYMNLDFKKSHQQAGLETNKCLPEPFIQERMAKWNIKQIQKDPFKSPIYCYSRPITFSLGCGKS